MRTLTLMRFIRTCLFYSVLSGSLINIGKTETGREIRGHELYQSRCAPCHDTGLTPRAPARAALTKMSPDVVYFALTSGAMRMQAAGLSAVEREAIVRFVTNSLLSENSPSPVTPTCGVGTSFSPARQQPQWNGWGGEGQRRFQPEAMARLGSADVPRLRLKWAFGFEGAARAYAQPTVVGGRIFVGSENRRVYSLDADKGCTYWVIEADFPVRTAVTLGNLEGRWTAYFADQHANVYAVDAQTGKTVWKRRVDNFDAAIVNGAPTLAGRRLYVGVASTYEGSAINPEFECCRFRGSVSALDASTGTLIWKHYTIETQPQPFRRNALGTQLWGPSGAPVWSSPTLDTKKHRVYITTGNNYSDPASHGSDSFIALNVATGKRLWARQFTVGDAFLGACVMPPPNNANCPLHPGPDHDFASSAALVDLPKGRRALIAGQKSGVVYAVDPDRDGAVLWQRRVSPGGFSGGVVWGSAADPDQIYVAVSDVSVKPAEATRPGAQPSMLGTPMVLDPDRGGGLYALRLTTGEIVWHTPHPGCSGKPGCSPAQSAAVTAIPGVVFSGGMDGHLRAYSSANGNIIWDVDTAREYKTVNGVRATGGSLDGPGPVVVGGMLYVNSGYLYIGEMPGNVLLAYSIDGI